MTSQVSPKEFRKRLVGELEEICRSRKWDKTRLFDAFQQWCADAYCNVDQNIETEVEDSLLFSKDLGVDFLLEDSVRKTLIIGQCKHQGDGVEVKENDVVDFFQKHKLWRDRDWVRRNGSESAVEKLIDFGDRLKENWSVVLLFFSTGKASNRVLHTFEKLDAENQKENIKCFFYDFPRLKDFWVRSQSLEGSIPDEVEIQLQENLWLRKEKPNQTFVAIVKGKVLRDLYRRHKETLFAYNIRGYLGDRGINQQIVSTAEKDPERFFYFNNGISAICTDLEVDRSRNVLKAKKMQIINGAQTVGALNRANVDDEVEVLVRVTQGLSVVTDKGFNADIIRFNNSQNIIKISDFKANDSIQVWLENEFKKVRGKYRHVIPQEMVYVRKRGGKRAGRGSGQGLKFEELAKIRYAFLLEPTEPIASPKRLWASVEDGGVYEKIFGHDEILVEAWSQEEFEKSLVAVGLFLFFDRKTKEEAAETPELRSFNRLKYFAVSLAAAYINGKVPKISVSALLNSKVEYESLCETLWGEIRRTLIRCYTDATDNKKISIFALARSSEIFESSKKLFILENKLTKADRK
jgi:hypothetical protein